MNTNWKVSLGKRLMACAAFSSGEHVQWTRIRRTVRQAASAIRAMNGQGSALPAWFTQQTGWLILNLRSLSWAIVKFNKATLSKLLINRTILQLVHLKTENLKTPRCRKTRMYTRILNFKIMPMNRAPGYVAVDCTREPHTCAASRRMQIIGGISKRFLANQE